MSEYTPTVPSGYRWMKPGERYGQVTTIERLSTRKWRCECDCGKVFDTYGTHLRSGVTKTCGHWRAEPDTDSYNAVHLRIHRTKGKASDHLCADCGAQATAWAYNRSGVAESTSIRAGYACVYSTDESQYDPCCGRCHYVRDHPAIRALKEEKK